MAIGMAVAVGVALLLDRAWRRREGREEAAIDRGEPELDAAAGTELAEERPALTPPVPVLSPRLEDLSDEELVARVRAHVEIPAGVEVTAVEGAVVLFGRVPRFAFAPLLSRVASVPGVVDVEDRLTPVDDLGASELL